MDSQSKILIICIILSFVCGCWIGTLYQFNSANDIAQVNISIHITKDNRVVRVTSERVDQPPPIQAVNITSWIPRTEVLDRDTVESGIKDQPEQLSVPVLVAAASQESQPPMNLTIQSHPIVRDQAEDFVTGRTVTSPYFTYLEIKTRQCPPLLPTGPAAGMDSDIPADESCPEFTAPEHRNLTPPHDSILVGDTEDVVRAMPLRFTNLFLEIRTPQAFCTAPTRHVSGKNVDVSVAESCSKITQSEPGNLTLPAYFPRAEDGGYGVTGRTVTSHTETFHEFQTQLHPTPTQTDAPFGIYSLADSFMSSLSAAVEFLKEALIGTCGNNQFGRSEDLSVRSTRQRIRGKYVIRCEKRLEPRAAYTGDLLHTAAKCWNNSRDAIDNDLTRTCANSAFQRRPALDLAGLYAHSRPPLSITERFTYQDSSGQPDKSWNEVGSQMVETVVEVVLKTLNVTSDKMVIWTEKITEMVADRSRKWAGMFAINLDAWVTKVRGDLFGNESPKSTACGHHKSTVVRGGCERVYDASEWVSQTLTDFPEFQGFESLYSYFQAPDPREKACGGYSNTYAQAVCRMSFDAGVWIDVFMEETGKFLDTYVIDPTMTALTDFQYLWEKMGAISDTIAEATRHGLDFGNKISVKFRQIMESQVITAYLHEISQSVAQSLAFHAKIAWTTCRKVLGKWFYNLVYGYMYVFVAVFIVFGWLATALSKWKGRRVREKSRQPRKLSQSTKTALGQIVTRMKEEERSAERTLSRKLEREMQCTSALHRDLLGVKAMHNEELEKEGLQDRSIAMMHENAYFLNQVLSKKRGKIIHDDWITGRMVKSFHNSHRYYENEGRRMDAERARWKRFLLEQQEIAEREVKELEEALRRLPRRAPLPTDVTNAGADEDTTASGQEDPQNPAETTTETEKNRGFWKPPSIDRSSSVHGIDKIVPETPIRASTSYHIDTRDSNINNAYRNTDELVDQDNTDQDDQTNAEGAAPRVHLSREDRLSIVSKLLFPLGSYKRLTKLEYMRMKICQIGLEPTRGSIADREDPGKLCDDVVTLMENSAPTVLCHLPLPQETQERTAWLTISPPTTSPDKRKSARQQQAEEDEAWRYLEAMDMMDVLSAVHPKMPLEDLRRLAHLKVWSDRTNQPRLVMKVGRRVNRSRESQVQTNIFFPLRWIRGRRYRGDAIDYGRYLNAIRRAARYVVENINWLDLLS